MKRLFSRGFLAILVLAIGLSGCGGGGEVTAYAVTYDGNGNTGGGVSTDSAQYLQGQDVTVLGNTGDLVKTDSAFAGWNTQADGSGTTYTPGETFTMGTANITLYAIWNNNVAYIYDSVDSPACTTITTLLSGYSVTPIPHDTVTITTASLSSYALIIIADQTNPAEYNSTLANAIIDTQKPIFATGNAADYFYNNQSVVFLPGLSSCGGGGGLVQVTPVNLTNPIWTTPNSITGNPVTIFTVGHDYHAVTEPNWPDDFATKGISIATNGGSGSPTYHVLAREFNKYFFWGLYGSIDDLDATGKNLFVNAVHYLLNY